MTNIVKIEKKIGYFKKTIVVPGDKSLSIRWVLFSSMANGKSKAVNLLLSEDVLATINAVKKLGIKVKLNKKCCTIFGNGPDGYHFKKNIIINAQNSGTLGRARVHVPWTCDHGPRRVDGLAKLAKCGFV